MPWENQAEPGTPAKTKSGGGGDGYPLGAPEPEPEAAIAVLREETPKERKQKAAALKTARQRAEKAAKNAQKAALKAHKDYVKNHTKMMKGAKGDGTIEFSEPPPPPSDDLSTYLPAEETGELKALGWAMGAGGVWEEARMDSARSSNASSTASRRRQEYATGMPELDASAILPADGEEGGGPVDPEEAARLEALRAETAALEAELQEGVAACREAGDAALLAFDFDAAKEAYAAGLELDPG